jgi:hypothetical protein
MENKFKHVIAFGVLLLAGCSYYGTDTFLVPQNNEAVVCSEMRVEISPILTTQNKRMYAFAGIPYFPALFPSTPPEIGDLYLWFQNISHENICTTQDLILKAMDSKEEYSPLATWRSKLVEKDGIKYLGCSYKFGQQLGTVKNYDIHFRAGLLNCEPPEVSLVITKNSGYHQVQVQ